MAPVPPTDTLTSRQGKGWTQIVVMTLPSDLVCVRSKWLLGPQRSVHTRAKLFVTAPPGHTAVRVLSKHDPDGLPPGHAVELLNVCTENALSAMDVRAPSVSVNKDALDLAKTPQD